MEPQADWKKLTEEELIAEFDKNEKNFTPECSIGGFVALIHLVREGRATAWLLPNGEIRYQHVDVKKK